MKLKIIIGVPRTHFLKVIIGCYALAAFACKDDKIQKGCPYKISGLVTTQFADSTVQHRIILDQEKKRTIRDFAIGVKSDSVVLARGEYTQYTAVVTSEGLMEHVATMDVYIEECTEVRIQYEH